MNGVVLLTFLALPGFNALGEAALQCYDCDYLCISRTSVTCRVGEVCANTTAYQGEAHCGLKTIPPETQLTNSEIVAHRGETTQVPPPPQSEAKMPLSDLQGALLQDLSCASLVLEKS